MTEIIARHGGRVNNINFWTVNRRATCTSSLKTSVSHGWSETALNIISTRFTTEENVRVEKEEAAIGSSESISAIS